jgi:hypothetical protein
MAARAVNEERSVHAGLARIALKNFAHISAVFCHASARALV